MSVEANPLLQPGQIGPLHVPNRVIMAPMTTRKADRDGFVTELAPVSTGHLGLTERA